MGRVSLAFLCASVVLACAAPPATAQEVTLRSADIHPDGYPTVEAVRYMGELVRERSGGRIDIQVFSSGQLGEEKDTIEQTQFGVIEMNRVNSAPFNNLVPETQVLGLPFLFRDVDHMHKVVDGEIGQQILDAFEDQNLIGLAFYDSGARSFYTTNRAVRSVEDMQGLKVRVQQSDLWIAMLEAVGANPTPMSMGEVYSSLETGVVDGAENNWPTYESSGHYEIAKSYTLTQHSLTPEVLVMSKMTWDTLSAEDQDILRTAAKDSVTRMRELWQAREASAEEKVRAAGVEVIEVDKQPFVDAMRPVYERFASDPELSDLVERIRAVQ